MRLPNGFGSVYKLSGNRRKPWVARKTTGWTFDEEKQKSYPIYAFVGYYESRKEALTALAEYNKDPYDLHHNTITFAEVFEKWSEVHFPKVSESNVKGYKASFRTCEKLHNMKFVEIKLDHLQQAVDESGKNTPTLKKMKIMFGLMYDYAVMHEIVTADKRDMVRYVDITKAGNPNAYNRKPFNKKQINMVWKVKDSNTYYSVILMLIYTGVRIGELLDLKVVPFFQYWLDRDCEYLICTPDDKHFLYRNYYDSYWTPLMEELKLQHRPHDTRHTCVSLLTEAGVDERIIKKIVGHKGQGVTETVYTHIELPFKLEAINKI